MLRFLIINLYILFYYSFDLPTGFFLDIDGISVSLSGSNICSLESKPGVQIGGIPICWGYEEKNILKTPKNEIFVQIVVNSRFACGVTIDQNVKCWGQYESEVPGLYSQIATTEEFACGILVDGNINCWGRIRYQPPSQLLDTKYVQVSCGLSVCCALNTQGKVNCWGPSTSPILITPVADVIEDENGIQTILSSSSSSNILSTTTDFDEVEEETDSNNLIIRDSPIQFKQISVGNDFACGIQYYDSQIKCWGNLKPVLKNVDKISANAPYRQVSAGPGGVCMISQEDNEVTCLGKITPLKDEWDQIKVGKYHVCGVSMDSELKCSGPIHLITASLPSDFIVA